MRPLRALEASVEVVEHLQEHRIHLDLRVFAVHLDVDEEFAVIRISVLQAFDARFDSSQLLRIRFETLSASLRSLSELAEKSSVMSAHIPFLTVVSGLLGYV